jgi:hypothetical protein
MITLVEANTTAERYQGTVAACTCARGAAWTVAVEAVALIGGRL